MKRSNDPRQDAIDKNVAIVKTVYDHVYPRLEQLYLLATNFIRFTQTEFKKAVKNNSLPMFLKTIISTYTALHDQYLSLLERNENHRREFDTPPIIDMLFKKGRDVTIQREVHAGLKKKVSTSTLTTMQDWYERRHLILNEMNTIRKYLDSELTKWGQDFHFSWSRSYGSQRIEAADARKPFNFRFNNTAELLSIPWYDKSITDGPYKFDEDEFIVKLMNFIKPVRNRSNRKAPAVSLEACSENKDTQNKRKEMFYCCIFSSIGLLICDISASYRSEYRYRLQCCYKNHKASEN